jgi:hypothetical protein
MNENGIGMFLEVERPDAPESQQRKRIRFYERLGAKKLYIDYQFPTIDGPYPMYLFFKPSQTTTILPKESIKAAVLDAYDYIHSDVPNKGAIAGIFLHDIKDQYFH